MSRGAPGPRSFMAGHSGVVSSVLMCHEMAAHDVCVAGYSFPNAFRAKPSQAKPSQSVNCLLAFPAFDRFAKLYQGNMLALTIL